MSATILRSTPSRFIGKPLECQLQTDRRRKVSLIALAVRWPDLISERSRADRRIRPSPCPNMGD
jgi:hypothetical protein